MEHAEGAALLAGAVVAHQQDQRVVEFADGRQVGDQASDLDVGVLEERGVGLLESRGESLLVLGELLPRVDALVARRQFGERRDDAELLLTREPLVARDVPSLVVATPVAREVLRWRLVRGVRRAEGQVREERSVGTD